MGGTSSLQGRAEEERRGWGHSRALSEQEGSGAGRPASGAGWRLAGRQRLRPHRGLPWVKGRQSKARLLDMVVRCRAPRRTENHVSRWRGIGYWRGGLVSAIALNLSAEKRLPGVKLPPLIPTGTRGIKWCLYRVPSTPDLPSWGPFLTVTRAQTLSKLCHFTGLGVFWVLFRQKAELLIFTYPLKSRACSLLVCLFINKSVTEMSEITCLKLKLRDGARRRKWIKVKKFLDDCNLYFGL